MNSSKLTVLVPSTAYTLAYTLPLLLISVLLIFAGSFLTLDRTRSFPPSESEYSSLPGTYEANIKKRKFSWRLEGGVGGLAVGYAFGVHLSTLLSLLIPATTSCPSLTAKSFIAVWVLSCIPTTALGGLRRHAALLFAGIGGGIAISVGLSIILHPSLLPRKVLLGVFSSILTSLLFASSFMSRISFFLRPTLRISCSSLGALGLVISIALLSRPTPVMGWANPWERFWLANGDPAEWGTGKEKGLSAAWAVFWAIGIVSDWALRRWVGECPDEKWDSYLSKLVSDPPNRPDRAGTFQPLQSFWDRHFSKPRKGDDLFFLEDKEKDEMIFPSEKDLKAPASSWPKPPGGLPDALYSLPPPKPVSPQFKSLKKKRDGTRSAKLDEEIDVPNTAAYLRKKPSTKERWKGVVERRRKKPVKFGTFDELSNCDSESSADEDEAKNGRDLRFANDNEPKAPAKRPFVVMNPPSYSSDVSSASTLVEGRRSTSHISIPPNTAKDCQIDDAADIDYDKELERLQAKLGSRELPTYSDDDDADLKGAKTKAVTHDKRPTSPSWSPPFLERHRSRAQANGVQDNGNLTSNGMVVPPVPGAVPLPATPSLIRAVDRIVQAQETMFGVHAPASYPSVPEDEVAYEKRLSGGGKVKSPKRWDDFWKEVTVKAHS